MLFEREASRNKVKLLDQVRITLRTNHYSRKTIIDNKPTAGLPAPLLLSGVIEFSIGRIIKS